MSYRLDVEMKPLIWVEVSVDVKGETRMEYCVKARANFKPRSVASNCDIYIPLPSDVVKAECKGTLGVGTWDMAKERLHWNIKHFQGQVEASMKISLAFPSVRIGKFSVLLYLLLFTAF